MFDKTEINKIDKKYFQILQANGYHIIIKSKNTNHTWDIYCRDCDGYRSLIISHKHKEDYPFHEQAKMHQKTVMEAQELIKSQDKWHLQNR